MEHSDLWQIDPGFSSRGVIPVFDAHYENSIRKHDKKTKAKTNAGYDGVETNNKSEQVSLLPSLLFTFGPTFLIASGLKIVADLLAVASPQIMKLLIRSVLYYVHYYSVL